MISLRGCSEKLWSCRNEGPSFGLSSRASRSKLLKFRNDVSPFGFSLGVFPEKLSNCRKLLGFSLGVFPEKLSNCRKDGDCLRFGLSLWVSPEKLWNCRNEGPLFGIYNQAPSEILFNSWSSDSYSLLSLRVPPERLYNWRNEGSFLGLSSGENMEILSNVLITGTFLWLSLRASLAICNFRGEPSLGLSLRASPAKLWNFWNEVLFFALFWRASLERLVFTLGLSWIASWELLFEYLLSTFFLGDFGPSGVFVADF